MYIFFLCYYFQCTFAGKGIDVAFTCISTGTCKLLLFLHSLKYSAEQYTCTRTMYYYIHVLESAGNPC